MKRTHLICKAVRGVRLRLLEDFTSSRHLDKRILTLEGWTQDSGYMWVWGYFWGS